ncbi:Mis12 protein-domain-containing protein [Zychaea mexicana]|uniref:Mis12 protein-domain-containing protein n=1 Tax=Zychaea mexicana TaxID=64656 RepID=UPI0022FF45AE|nr:Mis12 protein-domain-containing protein [Zychaea mexicana]KAI9484877.1 Mis12 protein-domain-containing protein [Zychaea mexicana]
MPTQNTFNENLNDYPRRSLGRIYSKTELLSEYFGFLPVELADDVYNAYNYVFYTALEALEKYLKNLDGLSQANIDSAIRQFECKVEQVLDKKFNVFERYLYDNILQISENNHIPMEHYKDLDLKVTEEQENLVDQELLKCRRAALSQKAMNHILNKKLNKLDRDSKEIESYLQLTQALSQTSENIHVTHPDDVIRFAADQCEQLRQSTLNTLRLINDKDLMQNLTAPDKRLKYMLEDVQNKLDAFKSKE